MSRPDFSKLNAETLREWRAAIDECIHKAQEKEAEAAEALRAKWAEEARAAGVTIDRVLGKPKGITKGGTLQPKYRNPDNPDQTWTGQGAMPKWMVDREGGVQLKGDARQGVIANYLITAQQNGAAHR